MHIYSLHYSCFLVQFASKVSHSMAVAALNKDKKIPMKIEVEEP